MYEAVRVHPDGAATTARVAATAESDGFEGIVVRNAPDASGAALDAVREHSEIDVVGAVEIDTDDPATASGHVGNHRSKRTLVIVHGGTPEMNRYAVEEPKVDVLAGPMAGEGDVNHVLANAAADNGVRIEFDLGRVLRSRGGRRVRALADLRKLREIVADADAPTVVSASPESHLELRAPRELLAVGETIGFEREAIEAGFAEWGRLAARNRHRHSAAFVEPGVERRDIDDE